MALILAPGPAPAQPLVADLADHLVAITAGFTGAEVVMFGATDGPGEVVVVVSGPSRPVVVRRKGRFFGVWINRQEMAFEEAPSFYALASSKPIDDILQPSLLDRYQLGLEHLRLLPPNPEAQRDDLPEFRAALVRNKQREGLYVADAARVTFLGEQLFRTKISFPANVATGTYQAQVYLVRDGQVVSAQTTPLLISKIGVGAEIYDFAQELSMAYGLVAVSIAVVAGYLASLAFRRS
ncbi:MAG: TIGR02186 family protein [Proteobacteria bacterium]|nr:TIGR02186 family protein [Pseudomonadota bacterium]MBI3497572.1 TIGR02186 family protein [Pseudomonadota bacterium]